MPYLLLIFFIRVRSLCSFLMKCSEWGRALGTQSVWLVEVNFLENNIPISLVISDDSLYFLFIEGFNGMIVGQLLK